MDSTQNQREESRATTDEPEFLTRLKQAAKSKARSAETHDTRHALELGQHIASQPTELIDLVLLGDSMFERLLTTGRATKLGPEQACMPNVFNAGVGGDRIVNVIYRLMDKGLLYDLKRTGVRHVMIEMGTNDLSGDKNAIADKDVALYALVIEALTWACPGVQICVCALNPRLRVKREGIVDESNGKLERMAEGMRDKGRPVAFMPSDPKIIDLLEDDGVHLNAEGYDLFAAALWERFQQMKGSAINKSQMAV